MSARAQPKWNQKAFVTLEGAWVELRAENPAELMRCAVEVGLMEVKHRGHPYYFIAPGDPVFAIALMGQRDVGISPERAVRGARTGQAS